ncbi:MAG: hypothetical protein SVU32_08010 [Candidatus Nanohaloarchaea archaeon]|nr:hypothetical protein [Candidatus Nanohaloarchaea archaeon]
MRAADAWKQTLIAVLAVIGVGFAAMWFTGMGPFSATSGGNTNQGTGDFTQVPVSEYDVDGQVTLPTNVASADVYLFKNKPGTSAPVHYGDYVDFSASEATSGLTQGVDYRKVSISSSSTATFSNLESGDYYLVLVDKSSPRDYHYTFGQVSMPSTVSKLKVTENQPVELTKTSAFTRFPTYKSDDTVSLNPSGETVALSADLDNPSSDVSDRQRTVKRTVKVSGGCPYLGELVVDQFNADDGIKQLSVSVKVDGSVVKEKTLIDGSTDAFGSDNAFSTGLTSEPQHDPICSRDSVTVTLDVQYDANSTATTQADNNWLENGESIADFHVEDIYGNKIGSAGAVSITG